VTAISILGEDSPAYDRGVSVTETRPPRADPLARVPSGTLVVGAIASVQFGSAIAATIFARVGPGGAVLLRLASATVVLGLLWRPRLGEHTRRELGLAILFGLVLAGMNLAFYHALQRIPLGIAVTIEFIGPLGVAVAGSRRRIDVLWIVLAAGGILALTHGGGRTLDQLGVLLALIAGLLWGAYILVNARVGRTFQGGGGLALAMLAATVVAAPVGLVEGGSALVRPHDLLFGITVGMLSSAIPYSLELEALRRIRPSVFGVLMSLEPAMAALAGFLILGQGLGARALLGMALVVAASVGASRHARQAPVEP
jgi:inner membrane transporter RhtA